MRKRIMFWLHDGKATTWLSDRGRPWDDLVTWFIEAAEWTLCKILGHVPERDQCGRPEHDFCLWCRTGMPGQARPRG